jgi:hypothetical protein
VIATFVRLWVKFACEFLVILPPPRPDVMGRPEDDFLVCSGCSCDVGIVDVSCCGVLPLVVFGGDFDRIVCSGWWLVINSTVLLVVLLVSLSSDCRGL